MANQLAGEKSPYLLQHADNPVHWRPWGEAAFAQARAEQKPIFLSIGYSTCHWCHVMAHESFENPEIAAVLNEYFVAIKVDREERPDVDKVYMTYVQSLSGHGGWPLSAWLTPELKPFYGGTYFPPENRGGRVGFPSLLHVIARGWRDERDKLIAEGERVIALLRQQAVESPQLGQPEAESDGPPSDAEAPAFSSQLFPAATAAYEQGFQHFYQTFDPAHGGFGGAPKFPRASNLAFLLRCAAQQGTASELGRAAIDMAGHTLRSMAQGGIHDHVGGGFHRYSVDEAWFVPHFEKMLYDQAQIAVNFLELKQATGDERYAWLARDIFDYVARGLTSPDGGFYSAEDADSAPPEAAAAGRRDKEPGTSGTKSEHVEGAFYVWTKPEIVDALGADAEFFCGHFGVKAEGNVAAALDPHGEFKSKNILAPARSLAESARVSGLTTQVANDRLQAALETMRRVQGGRPRPGLDDKVIAAWNGLMISALARGAQVLEGQPGRREAGPCLAAAIRAAEFVERELFDAERGILYRCWRFGRGTNEGFAEDYAYFIQGLLDLYEASFEIRWLQWAERLQRTMDGLFWDESAGGYFNSAAGDAAIILRLKEDYDGAEPAPSSVAAMNLLRLDAMVGEATAGRGESAAPTGRLTHRERGLKTLEAFCGRWSGTPHALPQMLCALELAFESPHHVVIAGDPKADDFRALAAVLSEKLGPRRTVLAADGGAGQAWLGLRAPWLAAMRPIGGHAAAYVCQEYSCQAPVTTTDELRRLLGINEAELV